MRLPDKEEDAIGFFIGSIVFWALIALIGYLWFF